MLIHTYLVTIAERKQGDTAASKEKEQKLQAILDTTKRVSMAKDQQISNLTVDLQATQEKVTALREENKELQLKGTQNEAGDHNVIMIIEQSM